MNNIKLELPYMKTITVSTGVDDSTKLQRLIDQTGNTAANYVFSENIEINSLLRLYNNTEFSGDGVEFRLMENAPTNPFGEQIPLIGPKSPKSCEGLKIHDIVFEGERDNQKYAPRKEGKPWGLGSHNFIGPGVISNPVPSNTANCEFYNLEFNNNLGDGIRVEGGTNILIHDIKAKRGGHDIICLSGVNYGEVYNLKADLAVNAAVRTRSAKKIKIHDCELNGDTGIAFSPGIEIQSTADNWTSSDIEIYNNKIYRTFGPGVQVAGTVKNNGLVSIHNNLFVGCGAMPAGNEISGVGGVVFDGFPVEIKNNTFYENLGYSILCGAYNRSSTYSYESTIKNNIIIKTQKSLYPGIYSGTGISCQTGARNKITVENNCQYGNKTANHYGVSYKFSISADPLFVDPSKNDYHLKSSSGGERSPCVFPEYELGMYAGTKEAAVYYPPAKPSVLIEKTSEEDLKAFIAALLNVGYLSKDQIKGYQNVSKGFWV
jgi:hypothetical protein